MPEGDVEKADFESQKDQIKAILERVGFLSRELDYLRSQKRWQDAQQMETDIMNALYEALQLHAILPVEDDRNPPEVHIATHMETKFDEFLHADYTHITMDDGHVIEIPSGDIPPDAKVGNLVIDVSWSERYLTTTGEGIKYHDLRIGSPQEVGSIILKLAQEQDEFAE